MTTTKLLATDQIAIDMGLHVAHDPKELSHKGRWSHYAMLSDLFESSGIPLGYWSYPEPGYPGVAICPYEQYEVLLSSNRPDSRKGLFDLVINDKLRGRNNELLLSDNELELLVQFFSKDDIVRLYQ